jgi:hypothetical protein
MPFRTSIKDLAFTILIIAAVLISDILVVWMLLPHSKGQ